MAEFASYSSVTVHSAHHRRNTELLGRVSFPSLVVMAIHSHSHNNTMHCSVGDRWLLLGGKLLGKQTDGIAY